MMQVIIHGKPMAGMFGVGKIEAFNSISPRWHGQLIFSWAGIV